MRFRPWSLRFGVRGRLLVSFLCISSASVVAATSALYSFGQVARVLYVITEDSLPAAIASKELTQQVDRVVAVAPALLAVTDEQSRGLVWDAARSEISGLSS